MNNPNQPTSQSFYQNICKSAKSFAAFADDPSLRPPSLLLQLHHNHHITFQPILYPCDCCPPSDNPIQLGLQLRSALFHVLWTASHSSVSSSEAAQLLIIAKHVADWTDNLSHDLTALISSKFLPRTFEVLQKALSRAQQENLFFPEFFTRLDGLQVVSFSQSFTSTSASLSHDHRDIVEALITPSAGENFTPAPSTPPDFSPSPPPHSDQFSPNDLIISTLLTQPPAQITLIPEHLRHHHPSLQHLTDDDISHCVQQNHQLAPLTLHFRAAYVDNDNQLLQEHIQSLNLPQSLSAQLLEQTLNASLARQLSFLATCVWTTPK